MLKSWQDLAIGSKSAIGDYASSASRHWLSLKRRHWAVISIITFLLIILYSGYPSHGASCAPVAEGLSASVVPDGVAAPINHFANYKSSETCQLSSLELFVPSKPICKDKQSLLRAMSSGGRIGFDSPYTCRYCDMTWYSTAQICDIISRFSHIYLIGDSLMRNLMISMHVLLREDLVNGGKKTWEPPVPETVGLDCTCNQLVETKDCSWFHGVYDGAHIYEHDPTSMACSSTGTANLTYHALLAHPLEAYDLDDYSRHLPAVKPNKPVAFVMSHGMWNDFSPNSTVGWLSQVSDESVKVAPWLSQSGSVHPQLLVTPNAQGENKPTVQYTTQNNFELSKFEKQMAARLEGTGVDQIGMWNMSIQAYSWDGTHAGMRTALVECMMILNWLNAYDLSGWIAG